MTVHTTAEEQPPGPSRCWCCGVIGDPAVIVHLGDHPEVGVCVGCAHFLSKQAWAIEDRSRRGPAVRARDIVRQVRAAVIHRGWHNTPIIGRALRWIGRFTP